MLALDQVPFPLSLVESEYRDNLALGFYFALSSGIIILEGEFRCSYEGLPNPFGVNAELRKRSAGLALEMQKNGVI